MLKSLANYGDMDVYDLLPAMTDAMPQVVQKMDVYQLLSSLRLLGRISNEAATERALQVQTLARDFASTMLDAIASKVAAGEMNEISLRAKVRTIWSLGELGFAPSSKADGIASFFFDRIPTESLHELEFKDFSALSWGLAQLDIRNISFLQQLAYAINEAIIVDIEKKVRKSNTNRKPLFREYLPLIAVSFTRLGLPPQDEANLFLFRAVGTRLQTGPGLYDIGKWPVAALAWCWPSDEESGLYPHLERLVVKHNLSPKFIETAWVGPTRWIKPPPKPQLNQAGRKTGSGRPQKQSHAGRRLQNT